VPAPHRLTRAQARRVAVRAPVEDAVRLKNERRLASLVGKLDVTADRKASVLRVNAIHEDVRFTRTITKAVQAELEDLAPWLDLDGVAAVR
jgi:uncharacterized protein YcaQ